MLGLRVDSASTEDEQQGWCRMSGVDLIVDCEQVFGVRDVARGRTSDFAL